MKRTHRVVLSQALIFIQLAIMGKVGGDYEAYELRGKFALENANVLLLNEPLTVLFANLSNITEVPLPTYYFILIVLITLIAINKCNNKFIYILTYVIFIIPVGVGYLRQGLAIAFILLLISVRSNTLKLINTVAPIVSHPSAALPVTLIYLSKINRKEFGRILKIILILVPVSYVYVQSSLDHYLKNYNEMNSNGYIYRLIIYAIIAGIFYYGKKLEKNRDEYSKLLVMQIFVMTTSVIVYYASSSTAADRVLAYDVPFIIALFAIHRNNILNIIILLTGIIYFISWLLLSPNAIANWQYVTIWN
jgi:hypothetical protein